jgi:hypothetical protein
LARGARMTIVDEQHAIADEHVTGDDWTLFSKNEIRQPKEKRLPNAPTDNRGRIQRVGASRTLNPLRHQPTGATAQLPRKRLRSIPPDSIGSANALAL